MLTLGMTLKFLRKHRKLSEDNSAMSQADLYSRARSIEGPPGKMRRGVGFPLNESSASKQAEKIRSFERDEANPTEHQLGLLEQALGLPKGHLARMFEDEKDLRGSIENLAPLPRNSMADGGNHLLARKDGTAVGSYWPGSIDSVETVSGNVDIPVLSRNQDVVEKLNQEILQEGALDGVVVAYVRGASGIGKSSLLFDWVRSLKKIPGRPRVVSLNARGKTGAEVVGEICQKVCGIRAVNLNDVLAGKFLTSEPTIVAIDHLISPTGQAAEDIARLRDSFSKISDFIHWADRFSVQIALVLFVQTAVEPDDGFRLRTAVTPATRFLDIRLEALSLQQSIELAKNLGANRVSDANLKRICERTDGSPMTIQILCDYMRNCSDEELEELIVSDLPGTYESPTFAAYMASYIAKMDARAAENATHPIAMLRLIALMPGATPLSWLHLLVNSIAINRIRAHSFTSDVEHSSAPFLIRNEASVDVHALARAEIRRDMDQRLANQSDTHLDAEEIKAIHLAMANVCRQLLSNKSQLRRFDTLAVELLVFHLMRFRELSVAAKPQAGIESFGEREQRIFSGLGSQQEIMEYCWEDVVDKYVIERGHAFTTYLGQHERKINLLKNFFPDRDFNRKIVSLTRPQANEVLKELSICYTHLGHLNAARMTIARATEHAGEEKVLDRLEAIRSWGDWDGLKGEEKAKLISYFEAIAHSCIVMWRRGDHYSTIENVLTRHRSFFDRVANFSFEPANRDQRPLLRAGRRFIARDGHMTLFHGRSRDALAKFEKAREIERVGVRSELTGEAGRRHIQAIARCAPGDGEARREIENIIQANLEYLARQRKEQSQDSMDEVSWHYTQAAYYRITGNFDDARKALERATKHPTSLTGSLSFYAQAELFMEQCRLKAATGTPVSDEVLKAHIQECTHHHHSYLVHEASILKFECCPDTPHNVLDQAAQYFEINDWYLKMEDIQLLQQAYSLGTALKPSNLYIA